MVFHPHEAPGDLTAVLRADLVFHHELRRDVVQPLADFIADMAQQLATVRAGADVRSDNRFFARQVRRQRLTDGTGFLFFHFRQQACKLRFSSSDIRISILFEQGKQ